jgi:hypothetical protein
VKYQFAQDLKDRHGQPFIEPIRGSVGKFRNLTFGDMTCAALDMPTSSAGPKDKARYFELIVMITAAEKSIQPLELMETDVDAIKERVAAMVDWPTTLYGAVMGLLGAPMTETAPAG